MAILLPTAKQSFMDSTGAPLVGGKLYTYAAGTTTLKDTYQDAAGTILNTNPIVLDSRGECLVFFSGSYKLILKDAAGVTIWTVDNINALDGGIPEISVKSFGAQGDGVTDDTAAFAAAVAFAEAITVAGSGDGGGHPAIHIPYGYYLTDNITTTKRLRFIGEGSDSTFIKLKAGSTNSLFTIGVQDLGGTSIDDASHSCLEGLTLIGNRVDSTTTGVSHGIYCPDTAWTQATQYSPSVRLSDIVIQNFTGYGILLGVNRNWALIDRCIVRYCNDSGLGMYSYDNRITSSDFGICKNYGVRELAGGSNVFTGCNLYYCAINYVSNSTSNGFSVFNGCSFDYAQQHGASIAQATGPKKFIGCRFYGNSQSSTGTYSDIFVTGGSPNSTVSVCGSSFLYDGTRKTKYLLETSGVVSVAFQANDYIRSGASVPYATGVSNTPAALQSANDLYFNVVNWGAVGDGATDDSAAINAALAAAAASARTVFVPNAIFLCASQIVVDQCSILSDNGQFQFSALSGTTDCMVLKRSSPLAPLHITGLKVNANSTGRDAVLVQSGSGGCDFMNLHKMAIQGAVRDALAFEPSANNFWIQNFRVSDLRVYTPGRHGIRMIAPNLSNTFINQGIFDNIDIRGAGQTTAGYDVYCDTQSTTNGKISEIDWRSCDFDAAGAANHNQCSIYLDRTGTTSGYDGWTFINVTPEDTGSRITGFPNVIQMAASVSCNGLMWFGGVIAKYGLVAAPSAFTYGMHTQASSGRNINKLDMTAPGLSASYANDAAAAAAGIVVGQTYRNGSNVCVRVV